MTQPATPADHICHDCAISLGGHVPQGHLATWHRGRCSWCLQMRSVTDPRDYRIFHGPCRVIRPGREPEAPRG